MTVGVTYRVSLCVVTMLTVLVIVLTAVWVAVEVTGLGVGGPRQLHTTDTLDGLTPTRPLGAATPLALMLALMLTSTPALTPAETCALGDITCRLAAALGDIHDVMVAGLAVFHTHLC